MLNFRLVLSNFQRKSLERSLEKAVKRGQLPLINRIKAVTAVADGYPFAQIAKILQVNQESIRQWVIKYLTGGIRSLCSLKKKDGTSRKTE